MAIIIKYSTDSTPNTITNFDLSGDGPSNIGLPNTLVFDDSSEALLLKHHAFTALVNTGLPMKYMKHVSGNVVEMTAGEKSAVDTAETAAITAQIRSDAKAFLIGFVSSSLFQRAVADIIKDEINILRKRDRDRAIDVAGAGTLAALKTAWAARADLTDRTLDQLKTAINNRVDDGTVDT